jgi:hypothetical protein
MATRFTGGDATTVAAPWFAPPLPPHTPEQGGFPNQGGARFVGQAQEKDAVGPGAHAVGTVEAASLNLWSLIGGRVCPRLWSLIGGRVCPRLWSLIGGRVCPRQRVP